MLGLLLTLILLLVVTVEVLQELLLQMAKAQPAPTPHTVNIENNTPIVIPAVAAAESPESVLVPLLSRKFSNFSSLL